MQPSILPADATNSHIPPLLQRSAERSRQNIQVPEVLLREASSKSGAKKKPPGMVTCTRATHSLSALYVRHVALSLPQLPHLLS